MANRLRDILDTSLAKLSLSLDDDQRSCLLCYLNLLSRWNRVYNLTAVRDPVEMVHRHIMESLFVLPYLHGSRLLDVGTGAGLPGLVLAVARPQDQWVLLDISAKKTRFCLQAVAEMGVRNVEVVRSHVEAYAPELPFSTVISRAFGSIVQLVRSTAHLSAPGARTIAMKGKYPGDELEELGSMRDNATVVALNVPGLEAERHLILVDAPVG